MDFWDMILDRPMGSFGIQTLGFFLTSIVMYSCFFRRNLKCLFIYDWRKLEKSDESNVDIWIEETPKQKLRRFLNWIVCKNIPKDYKKPYFWIYALANHVYILLAICCFMLWLVGLFYTPFRSYFTNLYCIKIVLFDGSILIGSALVTLYVSIHKWYELMKWGQRIKSGQFLSAFCIIGFELFWYTAVKS